MLNHIETIIFISGTWPDNSKGYSIANLATLDFFSSYIEKCIYIGPSDEKVEWKVKNKYQNVDFAPHSINRKPKSIRFIRSLLSRFPAVTERFWNAASNVEKEIDKRCSKSHEKICFFYEDLPSAYLLFHLKKRFPASVHIVRSHNVVYKGFKGLKTNRNPFMNLFWHIEVNKIKAYEKKIYEAADQFFAISEDDASYYREKMNIKPKGIIDFFLDFEPFVGLTSTQNNVIYLGSADLRKGQALSTFIQTSWPVIRDTCPGVNLLLGGRGTESFHSPANRVYGHGFIESETEFLQSGSLFINPQLVGAGIKIKSLIALASSKLLVATKTGAEGTGLINGVHCIIEDDFSKQAEIIIRYLKNQDDYRSIIEAGQKFVFGRFSKKSFYKSMQNTFFPEN